LGFGNWEAAAHGEEGEDLPGAGGAAGRPFSVVWAAVAGESEAWSVCRNATGGAAGEPLRVSGWLWPAAHKREAASCGEEEGIGRGIYNFLPLLSLTPLQIPTLEW